MVKQMTIFDFLQNITKPSCSNCAFINRKRRKITGTKNHLVHFGCTCPEMDDLTPGVAVIGREYELMRCCCGCFTPNE